MLVTLWSPGARYGYANNRRPPALAENRFGNVPPLQLWLVASEQYRNSCAKSIWHSSHSALYAELVQLGEQYSSDICVIGVRLCCCLVSSCSPSGSWVRFRLPGRLLQDVSQTRPAYSFSLISRLGGGRARFWMISGSPGTTQGKGISARPRLPSIPRRRGRGRLGNTWQPIKGSLFLECARRGMGSASDPSLQPIGLNACAISHESRADKLG